MSSNTTQTSPTSETRHYQALLQSSLSVTAIIYVLGFVVANSYYGLYGVFNYDLVQSRYLAAGFSFLSFTMLGGIVVGLLISLGYWLKPGNVEFFATVLFFTILGILIAYTLAAYRNSSIDFLTSMMRVSPFVILVMIVGCLISWVVVGGSVFTEMKEFRWIDIFIKNFRKLPPLITSTVIISYIVICASYFGQTIWAVLIPEYGGGKPYEAVFKLRSEYAVSNDLLFIPMQDDGVTSQLRILYETDKDYVVLSAIDNKQAIALRIPKDIIAEVVYAPYSTDSTLKPELLKIPTIISTSKPTMTPSPP